MTAKDYIEQQLKAVNDEQKELFMTHPLSVFADKPNFTTKMHTEFIKHSHDYPERISILKATVVSAANNISLGKNMDSSIKSLIKNSSIFKQSPDSRAESPTAVSDVLKGDDGPTTPGKK
ncbi:MAG: hypothetical protein HON78_00165 [Legionellales bacterium]|jgi:hypothetical protein|nr:hypothetical protein [Legionellales bacterium]